jgi:glycosyltransferase involved in cell wall biosynthesis
MRILIFSTAYFPLVGGAEIAIKEITDRLKHHQFDLITSCFSKNNAKEEKMENIAVYRVGLGMKFDKYLLPILGFLKAKKLFKKNKYSLIWSINASQAGLAALFSKMKSPKLPFLLTLQEGSSEQRIFRRRWIVWPLFKLIFKKADYIQTISKHLANFGKKMRAHCPIEVVPNGVNIEKFEKILKTSEQERQRLRTELHIKDEEKVIITVSRLALKNAIEDLIQSLKYLSLPVKLLILGTGFEEKKLSNLSKKLDLENKVLFLGLVPPDEVPKYLAISDVFVRPSISEGLGNVFLEAMAAGVPIIGTPVGGIPDFLKNGETGLFCQVRSPKSIAEAIKKILEDKNLRDKLIENGKKLVEENYSWDNIAVKMNKIFNRLLAPLEI